MQVNRRIDSHGFADLKRQLNICVSLTASYANDDPRKFKLGTPVEVWSSLSRAWTVEPTSTRIVEDISKLEFVLNKIIEKKGCVVPDEKHQMTYMMTCFAMILFLL